MRDGLGDLRSRSFAIWGGRGRQRRGRREGRGGQGALGTWGPTARALTAVLRGCSSPVPWRAASLRPARSPAMTRCSTLRLISRSIAAISSPVLGDDERDGFALGAGAAGAADAVHVVLGDVRQVEVDDVRQRLDVEAARGDVGGHQHAQLVVLEARERARARVLALVAVDRLGLDAVARSCCARRLAPCLVRVKTSTWRQSFGLDEVREQLALAIAATGWTTCATSSAGVPARDLDRDRVASGTSRRACGSRRRRSPRRAGSAAARAAARGCAGCRG